MALCCRRGHAPLLRYHIRKKKVPSLRCYSWRNHCHCSMTAGETTLSLGYYSRRDHSVTGILQQERPLCHCSNTAGETTLSLQYFSRRDPSVTGILQWDKPLLLGYYKEKPLCLSVTEIQQTMLSLNRRNCSVPEILQQDFTCINNRLSLSAGISVKHIDPV